jgi:hypothetical protein
VAPRAGLDAVEKIPGRTGARTPNPPPPRRPARSLSLYFSGLCSWDTAAVTLENQLGNNVSCPHPLCRVVWNLFINYSVESAVSIFRVAVGSPETSIPVHETTRRCVTWNVAYLQVPTTPSIVQGTRRLVNEERTGRGRKRPWPNLSAFQAAVWRNWGNTRKPSARIVRLRAEA